MEQRDSFTGAPNYSFTWKMQPFQILSQEFRWVTAAYFKHYT